jgi:hypothetical protein
MPWTRVAERVIVAAVGGAGSPADYTPGTLDSLPRAEGLHGEFKWIRVNFT